MNELQPPFEPLLFICFKFILLHFLVWFRVLREYRLDALTSWYRASENDPNKTFLLQPLMFDTAVQPSSHVQTPERRLRGFLHVYRNTGTSLTTFFSRAPSQGRINSPRSPELFPVYAFPSHVEESFWVYYCCSSCRWDSCRICPSAQAAASYSLHEISLCHLMYSGSLQHVLSSQTQKNEAAETSFDCGWRSVVFSKTEIMNKVEYFNLYVAQTSGEFL